MHKKHGLQDVEKLAYLKDVVKDSPGRHVIEGLLRTPGSYAEAIGCLREWYDRLRFIHQAHVCTILQAPSLRNGSGQELRHLHDVIKQHVKALEAMKYDLLEMFMSSVIELKLDQSSMFARQNHSRDHKKCHHILLCWNFLTYEPEHQRTSYTRMIESVTLAVMNQKKLCQIVRG